MKKTFRFVLVAVAVLAAASCAKEFVETSPVIDESEKVTFSLSLAGNPTKTELSEGKTVWAQGDSILFSDGSKSVKVGVPAEYVGMSYAEVDLASASINTADTVYAVYPPDAFKSAKAGVVNLAVSDDQSGNFEQANICVSMSKDYHFEMSNATAVMKFTVPEGIETVVLSAASADTLAGSLAVTCSTDSPISIKASSPLKSIKVATGGLDGSYYVAVIPGTYSDFTLMAICLDGQSQKKNAKNRTLSVNDLTDLGTIGDELSGTSMSGTGAEDDPFLIKDLADITTLATNVSLGLPYEGQYFKVVNNIEGVTLPIGYCSDDLGKDFYFQGDFDGNGKTITLNLDGDSGWAKDYVALFGDVGQGANIHDVIVDGNVSSPEGSSVAGLVGCINAGSGAIITNCTNKATVEGSSNVGGIVGYGDASTDNTFVISNCTNEGRISASVAVAGGIAGKLAAQKNKTVTECKNSGLVSSKKNVGGIVGYAYYVVGSNLENSGAITSTASAGGWWAYNSSTKKVTVDYNGGSAGIMGYAQNSPISSSTNTGTIKGQNKVGGIVGAAYWSNVNKCTNAGSVTATSTSQAVVGGIAGWALIQSNINDCINNGDVTGYNYVGGILGAGQIGNSSNPSAGVKLRNDVNNGQISATANTAGGIIGYSHPGGTTTTDLNVYVMVYACTNNGNVTAPYWVGGVMGYGTHYLTSAFTYIVNCLNTGAITGTRNDKDGGEVAGGMYGGCGAAIWAGPYVINSINTGRVQYREASHKSVYIGGIAGRQLSGRILNVCNLGYVGIESGDSAEGVDARMGAITGSIEKQSSGSAPQINYAYYGQDACSQIVGTSSTLQPGQIVSACGTDGSLVSPVAIAETEYSTIVAALNAYVDSYPELSTGSVKNKGTWKLYRWTEGPALVVPTE